MFIKSKKFVPYNKNLKINARELRRNMTAAEKKMWFEYLKGHNYRFVRQKAIGNYVLDFYCQKLKLGIEIDGESHIGEDNEIYDKKRTEELKKHGVEIIRFWNNDVAASLIGVENIVEEKIKTILQKKSGEI